MLGACVQIIDSKQGGMQTPTTVCWKDGEKRNIGKTAHVKRTKNSKHTVSFLLRLLDISIQGDQARMEHEKRFLNDNSHINMCEIKPEGGTVDKNKLTMDIEQIVACYIKALHSSCLNLHSKIFISYPSYFDYNDGLAKQTLQNALDISSIESVLVPEHIAIFNSYVYQNQQKINALTVPETVLFFDMGHSKTLLTAATFSAQTTQVEFYEYEPTLGGRDLDWSLLEQQFQKFIEENELEDVDLYEKKKNCIRMLDAVEKTKKALSSDTEAQIEIDYLHGDLELDDSV